MKRFKRNLIKTTLIFFLLLTHQISALCQTRESSLQPEMDSVEISLLTCGPRPAVYSLYGHTAIRYQDKAHGTDIVINYGMFSFGKPFFVLRFVFGLTDYEMGIEYFSDFLAQYSPSGCGVRQQTLNLTSKEKAAIAAAIDENYRPENRVYRYNYFYDNCTTRARDIITSHIDGTTMYKREADSEATFRSMIHKYNETHRWARFGNDLLLGVKADRPTTLSEQQFLPENLSNDFATAEIVGNGTRRNLVSNDILILPHTQDVGSDSFPLSPTVCMASLAALIVLLTLAECRTKANFWLLDTILMLADGLCGLILLAMVFSQHPTVSLNLQILLLNPMSAIMLVPTIKALRRQRANLWLKAWAACIILFIAGGFIQSYAEGMYFVALSLLFRYSVKIHLFKK